MDETFDHEMLRLIANPRKNKSFQKKNFDDVLYENIVYKFRNYSISRNKFEKILKIIENFLKEQQQKEIVLKILNEIIKNVSNDNRFIEIHDKKRNSRTLQKPRKINHN